MTLVGTPKVETEPPIRRADSRFTNALYEPYKYLKTPLRQGLDFRKEKTPKSGRFNDSHDQYNTPTYQELTPFGFMQVRIGRKAFVKDETLRNCVYVGFFEDFLPFGRLSRSFSEGEIEDLIERYLEVVEGVRFWKWSGELGGLGGRWIKVGKSGSVGGSEIGEELWKNKDQRLEKGLEKRLAESFGVDVAWGWWSLERVLGEEIRHTWERVSGRSAECENTSRDSYQVGESDSVRRALACFAGYASQGKLVSAAGQLVLCGRRPQRLIRNNVRHIKTCIRPRRYKWYGQEGFASKSPGLWQFKARKYRCRAVRDHPNSP